MSRAAASRPAPRIEVLRIGHRPGRDPRLSTHLALTARAFGAERLFLHPADPAIAHGVSRLAARWGGPFRVEGIAEWRELVRDYPGRVVHLTMYGEPLADREPELLRSPRLLVVVGGAKVPSELYGLAHLNLAVGHQPHSEVAALAVLLARLRGVPGPGAWPGATHEILPTERGKRVRRVPAGSGAQ